MPPDVSAIPACGGARWASVPGSWIGNATTAPPGIADLQIGKDTATTAP